MPTFAELRSKAAKMADATGSKITNTKDRMSSQSSKNINWDADRIKSKPPPPPKPPKPLPPPSRTSSASSAATTATSQAAKEKPPPVPVRRAGTSASPVPSLTRSVSQVSQSSTTSLSPHSGPPPVIRRETRPDSTSPPPPPQRNSSVLARVWEQQSREDTDIDRIDWANLSPEDKQIFFSWLDEFFAGYLHVPVPPRTAADTVQHVKVPPGGHTPPPLSGPPQIPKSSRPKTPPRPSLGGISSSHQGAFTMSYPPPTEHGSAGADLAHYFSSYTHWPSAWYTDGDRMAPPLKNNGHISYTGWWESNGTTQTVLGGVLFADLSMCWYSVSWPQNAPAAHEANDSRSVQRNAQYLPPPPPWDRERLVDAHETYGETIAGFVESFEGGNQPCARGECWDLANEALKYFEQYDYVPKPVPSISRTHGHLMYEGKASDKGKTQMGRWRGGDDRVRRGDIVEWRTARVGTGPLSWSLLGNPDHTAVIVSDMVPKTSVADGMAVRPAEMGTLEVIEQSLGKPPKRGRYDLSQFQEGEVWIYRPVGLEAYVGCAEVGAKCPEGVNALRV